MAILYLVLQGCSQPAHPPYPKSRYIETLTWAPPENVIRLAHDSDNWPTTWAADGALYTVYGDGHGFAPGVDHKLSMGMGKVLGTPPAVEGVNIYPTDADFIGQGASGKKGSGILMVGDTLYLWVRNADNKGNGCQLGRSFDKGRTWSWAEWRFPQFGYCTFLNFGPSYQNARDEYVYTYTNDHPSAYSNADHFVLMRVPASQLFERKAFEFFAGMRDGEPVWTQRVDERAPVFTHEGRCRRSGITYNAALGRYFWWQQNDEDDTRHRYEGGFAVYEAPEPWGPWSTVYFTNEWDMGPGETGHFPTKWMSEDGREMYLVFSGNDQFSIRKATVKPVRENIGASP